jgi:hypothetical protein
MQPTPLRTNTGHDVGAAASLAAIHAVGRLTARIAAASPAASLLPTSIQHGINIISSSFAPSQSTLRQEEEVEVAFEAALDPSGAASRFKIPEKFLPVAGTESSQNRNFDRNFDFVPVISEVFKVINVK